MECCLGAILKFTGIFRIISIKQWPQKSTSGANLSLKFSQYFGCRLKCYFLPKTAKFEKFEKMIFFYHFNITSLSSASIISTPPLLMFVNSKSMSGVLDNPYPPGKYVFRPLSIFDLLSALRFLLRSISHRYLSISNSLKQAYRSQMKYPGQ